jgi:hypothetical protein
MAFVEVAPLAFRHNVQEWNNASSVRAMETPWVHTNSKLEDDTLAMRRVSMERLYG